MNSQWISRADKPWLWDPYCTVTRVLEPPEDDRASLADLRWIQTSRPLNTIPCPTISVWPRLANFCTKRFSTKIS